MIIPVKWRPLQWQGSESLALNISDQEILADSTLEIEQDGRSYHLRYRIHCRPNWQFRSAFLEFDGADGRQQTLALWREDDARWFANGRRSPNLDGCDELDISGTPFTNTLSMRRLTALGALQPGERREIRAAWLKIPEFAAQPAGQSYTWLGADKWKYQSKDFEALLKVDEHLLVSEYEGLWTRS